MCSGHRSSFKIVLKNTWKCHVRSWGGLMKIQCYDYDINDASDNGITK